LSQATSLLLTQKVRVKMLDALRFVPDEVMVRMHYRHKTGRWPDLKTPKRYSEKLQWYKLNYRNPLVRVCSDKAEVRRYVMSRGYGSLLNDVYAVFDDPEDINFDVLPDRFALKATLGSGMNLFVSDKHSADVGLLKSQMNKWVQSRPWVYGREWGYTGSKTRILVESLLPRDEMGDIVDYKFFCFDGRVYCLYVMTEYTDDHSKGRCGFFDPEFQMLPVYRADYRPIVRPVPPPSNLDEMLRVASELSEGFPHVRVDLYSIGGRTLFGEMTFYNAAGYMSFIPDSFDYELGEQFIIPSRGE